MKSMFLLTLLAASLAGAQNAPKCNITGDHPVKIYREFPGEFGAASIEDFGIVVPNGIYRGSRPRRRQDFDFLKSLGVKNIVTLEIMGLNYKKEERNAQPSGIHIEVLPIQATPFPPSDRSVQRALNYLNDQSNWPVYVHCNLGHHRTGLVLALYRVLTEGCTKEAADQEMTEFGYSPKYYWTYGLRHYFKKHTGEFISDTEF